MKAQKSLVNRCKLTSPGYSGKLNFLTHVPLLCVLLLGSTLFATSCVPSVAEPDWDQNTRMPADSTSGDTVGFSIHISPWVPGGHIVIGK